MLRRNFLALGAAAAVAPILPAVPAAAEPLTGLIISAWLKPSTVGRWVHVCIARESARFLLNGEEASQADVDALCPELRFDRATKTLHLDPNGWQGEISEIGVVDV